jgi:hypothetical protein
MPIPSPGTIAENAKSSLDKWAGNDPADNAESKIDTILKTEAANNAATIASQTSGQAVNTQASNQKSTVYYTKKSVRESHSYAHEPIGEDGKKLDAVLLSDGPAPQSVFNKYQLFKTRGTPINQMAKPDLIEYTKINALALENPTTATIISKTAEAMGGENLGYRYDWADFALARYHGKIPNNMMLTLRRFPFAAPDDIVTPYELGKDGKMVAMPSPDIARAVTYMGETPGNPLSEILKFSHGFNWKTAEAEVQTLQSQNSGRRGALGSLIDSSDILSAAVGQAEGLDAQARLERQANAGHDSFKETYPNHVFGPLNVIKEIYQREQGLKFEQSFTLRFEYKMKAIGGANPKLLFMDQLANIIALTYNTAPFWGGSARWIGDGSVGKPLGDISKLRDGDFMGFFGSVVDDLKGMAAGFMGDGGVMDGLKKLAGNLLSGGLMKLMNTPQGGQSVAALLSGDPTGQWHLTVGNPLNPMCVIGNLCCENTEITFEGALGIQDFPEKMVVTITLKPGRPRDKAEIESMFNSGQGRFYLQPEDAPNINDDQNTDAYGRTTTGKNNKEAMISEFRKLTHG